MASDIFHLFLTLSRDWTSFNVQVEITAFGDCSSSYGFFGNRQVKGNLRCFARLHIGRVKFKRIVITWVIRDAVKSYLAEVPPPPSPTPFTENHPAQKPLAEMFWRPPICIAGKSVKNSTDRMFQCKNSTEETVRNLPKKQLEMPLKITRFHTNHDF